MRLYGYWRSSASWRARIGLNLKGVAWEYVPVNLLQGEGEQRGDAHRARNPLGQVPVLEVVLDGETRMVSQSLVILELLEELHPTPPILPATAWGRARARMMAEVCNSGIQPLHNLWVNKRLSTFGVDAQAWNAEVITRGLTALEQLAAAAPATFLVGEQPGVADICLVPQLYAARRNGVEVAAFPNLLRVEAACAALEAFQAAHADRQVDAP